MEMLRRQLAASTVPREWLEQARRQMEAAEQAVPEVPPAPPEQQVTLEKTTSVAVGDTVWVDSLSSMGEILGMPDDTGQVEVQVGSFKVRRPVSDLRKASRREERVSAPVRQPTIVAKNVPLELELRGFRVADVEEVLDRYLNDAYLAGLPFVRIIHGKGTGVLRQVVREILSTHPLVASFAGAPDRDGGEGVTVAHMTSR
jgi:DNA mismatch repair protein MutS2